MIGFLKFLRTLFHVNLQICTAYPYNKEYSFGWVILSALSKLFRISNIKKTPSNINIIKAKNDPYCYIVSLRSH